MTSDLVDSADTQEYKDTIQTFARQANMVLFPKWVAALRESGKVEDLRKAVEFLTSMTAAAVEKKTDPNANLPVFNFIFSNGGMQAAPVQLVEVVEPAPIAAPTKVVELAELDFSFTAPPEVTVEQLAALRAELQDMLADIT